MRPDMVQSRADFSKFVSALRSDLLAHPERWENVSLEAFLEALSAAALDIEGAYRNRKIPFSETASWKLQAELLLMASAYE